MNGERFARIRWVIVGFVVALALSAPAGYALQEFTLDEARTRIERLEARVAALEGAAKPAAFGTPAAQETHAISGSLTIGSSDYWALEKKGAAILNDSCHGDAGFDDIRAGTRITVLDGAGNIIATGNLSPGILVAGGDSALVPFSCEFTWAVDVEDADFYVFQIGNRDGPPFSRADLEAAGWVVPLALGESQ